MSYDEKMEDIMMDAKLREDELYITESRKSEHISMPAQLCSMINDDHRPDEIT